MSEKFKKFSTKHKILFQIIAPIFVIAATISSNYKEKVFGSISYIGFEIAVWLIWIFLLILAVISYIIFYLGQKYTTTELSTLQAAKDKIESDFSNSSKKNLELQDEYDNLRVNYDLFFDKILILISSYLKLSGRDRVSVYFIPKDEEIFILKSRFSTNRALNSKSAKNYPFREGFIYKCVERGDVLENIDSNPENEIEEYIIEIKQKCDIDEERIRKMSMKSRSYFLKAINDDNTETIAVIVFESLDKDKFNNLNNNDEDQTLKNYLSTTKEFIVKHREKFLSKLATDKGF